MSGPKLDIAGKQFGRLTAIKPTGQSKQPGGAIWLTQCSCGNSKLVPRASLLRGYTRSCGCLHKDASRARAKALTDAATKKAAEKRQTLPVNKCVATLRDARSETGISMEKFANKLGYCPSLISKFERGESCNLVFDMADALGFEITLVKRDSNTGGRVDG